MGHLLLFLGACYLAVLFPFTSYLKERPVAVKLGYVPEAEALRMVAADQKYLIAQYQVVKVLFYFGTLTDKMRQRIYLPPEYYNMFKTLETAVKLDPYNLDAYYFAQAAFTWEVGRASDVNRMLVHGMRFRTWDYTLPFYVGFNSAYFLKDYSNAALYMKKGAEISGNPLYTTLASRYMYEAGSNDFAVLFLDAMEKGAKDKNIKKIYSVRKKALVAVVTLNEAVRRYIGEQGRPPRDLADLVSAGIVRRIPPDPYGGRFYLSEDGKIRTTSKFAFGSGDK
jgi:hypothetical protein